MTIHQIYWIKFEGGVFFLSRNESKDWDYRFYQGVDGDFQSLIGEYELFNNQGRRIKYPMSGRIYDIKSSRYKELSNRLESMLKYG